MKTLEEAIQGIKDFLSDFGLSPDVHPKAVEALAQLCVNDEVSELFQRMALVASYNAFTDEQKKQGMFMGMSHILNDFSLAFRPSKANEVGGSAQKLGF